MKKVLFTLMIIFLPSILLSQDFKWSMLPEDAPKKSESLINNFIKSFNNSEDLTKYLPKKEGNFGGQIWMPIKDYVGFINKMIPRPIESTHFEYYIFEDIENDSILKSKAVDLNRVFNNYSVMADGEINNRKTTFILQPENDTYKITSLNIWDVGLVNKTSDLSVKYDTIQEIKILIEIPTGFEGPILENGQINYYLKGRTIRDAAIQIMYSPRKAPINILTYSWVGHFISGYEHSDYEISYLPKGYVFKYELVDQNSNINKGITIGIENNGYSIIIQYFGFKDVYNNQWIDVDKMMRSLKTL
jgi:hypothetical protein